MPQLHRSPVPQDITTPDFATPRQVNFIENLLRERGLYNKPSKLGVSMTREWAASFTKVGASALIDKLKALPITSNPPDFFPAVPDGRYAIELTRADGEQILYFFKVTTGNEGSKWEGFRFLDAQFGPNYEPIKAGGYKRLVFSEIAKDPIAAMARYGKELGICGKCGLELTNEESRRLGIGPICRSKL